MLTKAIIDSYTFSRNRFGLNQFAFDFFIVTQELRLLFDLFYRLRFFTFIWSYVRRNFYFIDFFNL